MNIKLIPIVFISLLVSTVSLAQNFSVPQADTVFYGQINNGDFASKFIINNDSTDSFPMSWIVESDDIAAGWEYSICDPATCHSIGVSSASFDLPISPVNRMMNIHYFPHSNYGQSTVTVKLWQDQYPNEFTLLKWTGIISTLGLEEQNNYSIYAISTPGTNSIEFVYELPNNESLYHLDLHDMNGKLIATTPVNNVSSQTSIGENLSSGIYIYKLRSNNSTILTDKVLLP